MAIERTIVARCDEGCGEGCCGCPNELELDPDTTQPYRDLNERGWFVAVEGEAPEVVMKTYCPIHKDNHQES